MKTMALLVLLIASTLVASAQSPTVNQPHPPVIVRYACADCGTVITHNGNHPSAYHDHFNGPETTTYVGNGSVAHAPESFTSNEQAFLAHMENLKSSPGVVAQMLFCLVIQNTSAKPIKWLRLEFIASNRVTGVRYGPYQKRLRVKIKPGQEQTLTSDVALRNPADDFLKGVYAKQHQYDLRLVGVEYADGSSWNRP